MALPRAGLMALCRIVGTAMKNHSVPLSEPLDRAAKRRDAAHALDPWRARQRKLEAVGARDIVEIPVVNR